MCGYAKAFTVERERYLTGEELADHLQKQKSLEKIKNDDDMLGNSEIKGVNEISID